jgi:histone H3/H4
MDQRGEGHSFSLLLVKNVTMSSVASALLAKKNKKTAAAVAAPPANEVPSESSEGLVEEGDAAASSKTTQPTAVPNKPITGGVEKKPRKPHRWRPGTVAKREIIKEQKNSDKAPGIRPYPFARLVREIMNTHGEFRLSEKALDALLQATNSRAVALLRRGYCISKAAKRETLYPADVRMAEELARGDEFHTNTLSM